MKFATLPSASMLALVVLSALVSPSADAATMTRSFSVNGSGACQSALPVFDVQIRKRPKAVQNEGDKAAYVTCTYYSQAAQPADYPTSISVYASVNDGRADAVTCTGVLGYNGTNYPYSLKTIDLNEFGGVTQMFWTAADFGGIAGDPFPSDLFSVSCNLNPGVGINDARIFFQEDVGN